MEEKYLSVFIPIFNEEDNISRLYSELKLVLKDAGFSYEIIFIDDSSVDSGYEIIKDIAKSDSNVKVIHFKRNYGQTAAMQAGFEYSSGKIIISMDGDLQNNPEDIPKLIKKLMRVMTLCADGERTEEINLFQGKYLLSWRIN